MLAPVFFNSGFLRDQLLIALWLFPGENSAAFEGIGVYAKCSSAWAQVPRLLLVPLLRCFPRSSVSVPIIPSEQGALQRAFAPLEEGGRAVRKRPGHRRRQEADQ